MKDIQVAWYLDEDVLLEGIAVNNRFYPDTDRCGFALQEFDESMIDREIFFELEKALTVCGDVPMIRGD